MALTQARYLLVRAYDPVEAEDNGVGGDDAEEDKGIVSKGNQNLGSKKRQKGQNKARSFGKSQDAIQLCNSVMFSSEFSPVTCAWGERCNREHKIRKYLEEGRRDDLHSFDGQCPVFKANGRCPSGWKCRFVRSHMDEVQREDGQKELVLQGLAPGSMQEAFEDEPRPGVSNIVPQDVKRGLARKKVTLDKSDSWIEWLNAEVNRGKTQEQKSKAEKEASVEEYRAQFVDPPLKPSEKRRIYFGRETPVLAPLTTQGNLPFRRICVELGAQATYSEMALAADMLNGKMSEWALMKVHASELGPPRFDGESGAQGGYDNHKDLKFGAQIAAGAPWVATKATEAMARFLPHLRLIDLNCGCPIDLVYKTGAGSCLLNSPNKLERIVRGMNTVSGEIPITAKLRVGVHNNQENAKRNIERLAFGGPEVRDHIGAPGCAAVTLHGRSRQQRYKKPADWAYIAECAALVKSYQQSSDDLTDTVREPDARTRANAPDGRMYFLGNGDCYTHLDYFDRIDQAGVDTVMIARGALVKPWIFEEIEKGQYLDKSASERLGYVEKFARYGMEAWGSDEVGIGTTRRFLLEYLNFAYRYIPVGLLEHLPPSMHDRPPSYRGRNDLETLMASNNYKDWIKIRCVRPAPPARPLGGLVRCAFPC